MSVHLFSFGDCSSLGPSLSHQLARQATGLIATACIGWLGVILGIIFFIIANRLKWFRHRQYFLVLNMGVVGLMASFLWALGATRMLIYSPYTCHMEENSDRSAAVFGSTLLHFPANVLLTCTIRSALIMAIDHLYLSINPIGWLKSREAYRWLLISSAWLWSIGQECTWLIASSLPFSETECLEEQDMKHFTCQQLQSLNATKACCFVTELQCFRHTSTIPSKIFDPIHDITSVIDGITFFLAIAALITPRFISKFNVSQSELNTTKMEEYQLSILGHVRQISLIMLISYIPTLGLGSILGIWSNQNFGTNLLQGVVVAFSVGFGPLAFCFLARKDQAFRGQLKMVLCGSGSSYESKQDDGFGQEKKVPPE